LLFLAACGTVLFFATDGGATQNATPRTDFQRQPMDSRSRSLAKALSWRATGSIDTMLLSFIITGNVKIAATIGLTEIVTKSLLYYAHERIWLKVPYGKGGGERNIASHQGVEREA
jgi:uncharacterized membrane protein